MKNAKNAGQKPAASNLATQVQSRKLRWIAECPFCADDGKIAVDTAAMVTARERHGGPLHALLHEQPGQRMIMFGDDAGRGRVSISS